MLNVIAIHGVGDRKPGEVLDAATAGLSHQGQVESQATWKHYRGHKYRYADVSGHPEVASILEVNWDDISHPARTPFQLVRHFIAIIAAMLRVAEAPTEGSGGSTRWTRAYNWMIKALLFWCIYLPIVTIGGFGESRLASVAWLLGIVGLVVLLAILLQKIGRIFRVGFLWAAGTLLIGIVSIVSDALRESTLQAATFLYGLVQGATGIALIGAMFETWRRNRRARTEQRLMRLACLYLPFILFSGLGAVVWVVALASADYAVGDGLAEWGQMYLAATQVDLAFMEAVFAVAIALGGVLLLLPASALLRGDGALAHARLITALKLFPLLIVALFLLYLVQVYWFYFNGGQFAAFNEFIRPVLWPILGWIHGEPLPVGNPDVFEIYAGSSLRLVPFLAYLIGPFRKIADTIGDVVLYLDPNGTLEAGIVSDKSRQRLRNALNLAAENNAEHQSLILAHSQGTVIAADVLADYGDRDGDLGHRRDVFLVTMGSPLSSLYWRFIGPDATAVPDAPWLNLTRGGDYIAGGRGLHASWTASLGALDRNVGDGGHTEYFQDKDVWDAIDNWLRSKR